MKTSPGRLTGAVVTGAFEKRSLAVSIWVGDRKREGGGGGGDCEIRKSGFISRFLAFSPCPVTVYLRSLSFESFVNFPFLILPWINGER